MEPRSLKYLADACAGELRCGSADSVATNVCTDSRHARPGDLFFAIRGERFDGHDFLAEVAAKGVAAVVVEKKRIPRSPPGCAVVAVEEVRAAFGRLAAAYRKEFRLPMVAVAGSNGKTTTKDLLASVLSRKFSTLSSEASFNNDIGVPTTLLRLERSHQAAVLEAGTNHPGELAPLLDLIQPQCGVLTNIGREHLEFFGDVAGVAQEEGWLAERLPPEGTLFLNGDSEWTGSVVARRFATTRPTPASSLPRSISASFSSSERPMAPRHMRRCASRLSLPQETRRARAA